VHHREREGGEEAETEPEGKDVEESRCGVLNCGLRTVHRWSAVLWVPEGVVEEEEEDGIQRGRSKQQVEVTHEAKGGVYVAEEMGMSR
jgi:hypothetical protein